MSNDPVTVTSEFSENFLIFWLFCNVKSRWWFCFQQCAYITPSSSMFVTPSSRVFVTPSSRVFVTNCDRLWLETVLWIRDISVRIRIRILILGFEPFPNGSRSGFTSGSGSCFSRQRPKKKFFQRYFAYYFLKVHVHQYSKSKSQKELNKIVKVKGFLTFFVCWWKDPDPVADPISYKLWLIRDARKHTIRIHRLVRNSQYRFWMGKTQRES
jgi:hypothetical protein